MNEPSEQDIAFSIILPTYNRRDLLVNAVDSVLSQTYQNFELLIIDDGSTDATVELINDKYSNEIQTGKIRLFINAKNRGASFSRNVGLSESKNQWICYIDSDNVWKNDYLETFIKAIQQNSGHKLYYCQFENNDGQIGVSTDFDYKMLEDYNYIDIGVFVHHKYFFDKYGGFDVDLRSLEDWDLILRYSNVEEPVFINRILMIYDRQIREDRVSIKEDIKMAIDYVQKKNCIRAYVTRIESDLKICREQMYVLERKNQSLANDIVELENKIQDINSQYSVLKDIHVNLKEQYSGLERDYTSLNEHKKELENSTFMATKNVARSIIRKINKFD